MSLFLGILITIIIFSIIVFVHEMGHFSMARLTRMRVEEFGIGIPPQAKRLFTDRHGTLWTLNWLPIGGFIRVKGEGDFSSQEPGSLANSPWWARSLVLLAGVGMNFLFAYLIFFVLFLVGTSPLAPNTAVKTTADSYFLPSLEKSLQSGYITESGGLIISSVSGSLAQRAGIGQDERVIALRGVESLTLDPSPTGRGERYASSIPPLFQEIREERSASARLSLNGEQSRGLGGEAGWVEGNPQSHSSPAPFIKEPGDQGVETSNTRFTPHTYEEFAGFIQTHERVILDLESLSGGVRPVEIAPQGGKIGVWVGYEGLEIHREWKQEFGVIESAQMATREMYAMLVMTIDGFRVMGQKLFTPSTPTDRSEATAMIAGPLGIGTVFVTAVEYHMPWLHYLVIAAFISLSLGFFNLLPLPALDGGRWLTTTIHSLLVTLFPQSRRATAIAERAVHGFGFLLLMILSIIIAGLDVSRWF